MSIYIAKKEFPISVFVSFSFYNSTTSKRKAQQKKRKQMSINKTHKDIRNRLQQLHSTQKKVSSSSSQSDVKFIEYMSSNILQTFNTL